MSQNRPLDDLAQIRAIMERSTKFLSISALSAVLAGVYALVGAVVAYRQFYFSDRVLYYPLKNNPLGPDTLPLVITAATVLVMAVSTGLWLSYRKARLAGQRLWTLAARRLVFNFAIPMLVGACFVLVLYWRGYYSLLAASTLVFYGLALLNAGNFTFSDIRILGIWEVVLGLAALLLPGKGLLFWALGFGVLHILYGIVLYWKYERTIKTES